MIRLFGLFPSRCRCENLVVVVSVIVSIPLITMYLTRLLLGLGSAQAVLAAYSYPNVSTKLEGILNQAYQAPLYTYPTSLTEGIVPVKQYLSTPQPLPI